MSGTYLLLTGLPLFGFLPLFIILYRKRMAGKILTTGLSAKATVYHVYTSLRPPNDTVYYRFMHGAQQFTGSFMIKIGVYKQGDVLDIFYLPDNPKRNTVNGAWGSKFLVGFGIAIAAFTLFATYKIYQMIVTGSA